VLHLSNLIQVGLVTESLQLDKEPPIVSLVERGRLDVLCVGFVCDFFLERDCVRGWEVVRGFEEGAEMVEVGL
jgi:hypothetical protein